MRGSVAARSPNRGDMIPPVDYVYAQGPRYDSRLPLDDLPRKSIVKCEDVAPLSFCGLRIAFHYPAANQSGKSAS